MEQKPKSEYTVITLSRFQVRLILFSIFVIILFIGGFITGDIIKPIDNEQPPGLLVGLQKLSTLTTIEREFTGLVRSELDMPPVFKLLYGQSQALMAVGHIKAGIDLSQLKQSDLQFDADRNLLVISLPPATLLECYLDDSKTRILNRETGIFSAESVDLDADSRHFALTQFREIALESEPNILEQAQVEAEIAVRGLIGIFDTVYSEDMEVQVVTQLSDPDFNVSETCQ
jgi:hypothetical protein